MPPRSVTRVKIATSAELALLAEPPQNSFVAENEEQLLQMRLPEAQVEREKQASARSSARRSRSRGRKRFVVALVIVLVFLFFVRGEEPEKT